MLEPSRELLDRIGSEFDEPIKAIREKYPGLEVVVCFTMPRRNGRGWHSTSVGSSLTSTKQIFQVLVHAVNDLQKRMRMS